MKSSGEIGRMRGWMRSARVWKLLLAGLVLLFFTLRLSGPSNLEEGAQNRNVGYVMDAVWQGHWLVQQDLRGRIMSKPPLHTWLAASLAEFGGINRLTLALPSALSVLALAWLVLRTGRRCFGPLAGGLAGFALVLAPMMHKQVALVRTDALFALAVALAALAAWQAWERGKGWTSFWVWAALATLIKGPFGLLAAALGLLAVFWERRTAPAAAHLRGSQGPGIALFLLLTLGWLVPALISAGQPLVDKLLFEELFGQATGLGKSGFPGRNLPKPTLFFLLRFFPFSLFALYGLWRIVRHPASEVTERRFERFLFCWFVVGLLILSLASHHRGDLLLPIWAPAALIAGREMARLAARHSPRQVVAVLAGLTFLMIAVAAWRYLGAVMRDSPSVHYVRMATAAAKALKDSDLDVRQIQHLDTATVLQLELGTFNVWLSENAVRERSRGAEPLFLAVERPEHHPKLFETGTVRLKVIYRWPADGGQTPFLTIFANPAGVKQYEERERHLP